LHFADVIQPADHISSQGGRGGLVPTSAVGKENTKLSATQHRL
jgi:hypothetical protein